MVSPRWCFSPLASTTCVRWLLFETLSAHKLIDRIPHPLGTETTESTEVSQTESDSENTPSTTAGPQRPTSTGASINTTEDTGTLYGAALILKILLCDMATSAHIR